MSAKIVYGLVFLMAFAITTAALVYLNNSYVNIFAFDFTSRSKLEELKSKSENKEKADSTSSDGTQTDSTMIFADDSSKIIDEKKIEENKPAEENLSQVSDSNENIQKSEKQDLKTDEKYLKWKKNTIKIYESMDSKKVAKLISTFSDNVASDLIYSMKAKKAAEILSHLDETTLTRLTRYK